MSSMGNTSADYRLRKRESYISITGNPEAGTAYPKYSIDDNRAHVVQIFNKYGYH